MEFPDETGWLRDGNRGTVDEGIIVEDPVLWGRGGADPGWGVHDDLGCPTRDGAEVRHGGVAGVRAGGLLGESQTQVLTVAHNL